MTIKDDMRALTREVQRTRELRATLTVELQQTREALDAASIAEDNATTALLDYVLSYAGPA